MKKRTLEEIALSWSPENGDRYGEDKKSLLNISYTIVKDLKMAKQLKLLLRTETLNTIIVKRRFNIKLLCHLEKVTRSL